jgi:hypothetical protein
VRRVENVLRGLSPIGVVTTSETATGLCRGRELFWLRWVGRSLLSVCLVWMLSPLLSGGLRDAVSAALGVGMFLLTVVPFVGTLWLFERDHRAAVAELESQVPRS